MEMRHLLVLSAGGDVLPATFVWNSDQDVQYVIVFQLPSWLNSEDWNYSLSHTKALNSFPVLLWWRQFLVADWQEWGGEDCTACITTPFLSPYVCVALGWQQRHLLEQDFFGLEVGCIFSLAQGHSLKYVTWRPHSLLSSKSVHQSQTYFPWRLSP